MISSQKKVQLAVSSSQISQNKVNSQLLIPPSEKGKGLNDSLQNILHLSSPLDQSFPHVEPKNALIERIKAYDGQPQCEAGQVSNRKKIEQSSEQSIISNKDSNSKIKQPDSEYQQILKIVLTGPEINKQPKVCPLQISQNSKREENYFNRSSSYQNEGTQRSYPNTSNHLSSTFEPCIFDPENDANKEIEKLKDLHSQLQKQRQEKQILSITRAVERNMRKLASNRNWEFNKFIYDFLFKNLLNTFKDKVKSIVNKQLNLEQIFILISYLESLLGQCDKRQVEGKENDQRLSNKSKRIIQEIQQSENKQQIQDESQGQERLKKDMYIKNISEQDEFPKQQVQIKLKEGNQYNCFTYVCFFKVKKPIYTTICDSLKKLGIKCILKDPYKKIRLKQAPKYLLLYHNIKFEELVKVIRQNHDFKFKYQQLSLIFITQYLKLTKRNKQNQMKKNDFIILDQWLKTEYPQQTLSLWQFLNENDKLEYFLCTDTKESRVYLYIVMAYFNEESYFKNPESLELLSKQEEYEKKFKKVYSS